MIYFVLMTVLSIFYVKLVLTLILHKIELTFYNVFKNLRYFVRWFKL